MSPAIFVVLDDKRLVPMEENAFALEADLEALVAAYPQILAGEAPNSPTAHRYVHVRRQAGIPAFEGGGDRWSLDNLFLDEEGIPTLDEVKRKSDTRSRREVVGQLFDYAANFARYWTVDRIRDEFEAGIEEGDRAVAEVAVDGDIDAYWDAVATNIAAGRLRLIFLLDEMPTELQAIVEFLSAQISPAEVRAVHVKRYGRDDGGVQTLVADVVGATAQAKAGRPGSRSVGVWDEERFFTRLIEEAPEAAPIVRGLYDWADGEERAAVFGSGSKNGSFEVRIPARASIVAPIRAWTDGSINVNMRRLSSKRPFDARPKREELIARLNAGGTPVLPVEAADETWPSFRAVDVRMDVLTGWITWIADEVSQAEVERSG